MCIAIELFISFKNFCAAFLFCVIIQSVCIVPYLLIWFIASNKSLTILTDTIGDKYSFDQSLFEAFCILPLYKFLILLSPMILQPFFSRSSNIGIPIFFIVFSCIKIVSVAPQIAVFLNLEL